MCLSVPGEIISIDGQMAKVSIGGTILNIGLQLMEGLKEGDFVLVHSGFAIQKLNKEEADEIEGLFREMNQKGD